MCELLGWKNLARQHEIQKATMVYKSLHELAPEYLCSRFAIRETALNLYHGQIITKIPLPTVAPFNGTNSHVIWGKQSPVRKSNVFLNKYSRTRHSWKAAFYLIFFYTVDGFLFELQSRLFLAIYLSIYLYKKCQYYYQYKKFNSMKHLKRQQPLNNWIFFTKTCIERVECLWKSLSHK